MGYISQNTIPSVSFQSKRLRRSVEPRRGAGRRNLGSRVWLNLYAPRPPIGREAALCKALAPPSKSQKLPCTATADPKTREVFTHQIGGCRAGKFGEGQGGLEGREPLSRGLPAPPRSSPYPFLRTYLRTKATARRASGIRIAKTMIQTTKTVTETFRRADGRTCDSPIGYCRSSPASHERIAAV